ncbi:DNA polymerase Y family protein [Rhodobacteraceae bacterium N5(2021)]|uniref:DNA-directed DNA polymerase n=1 Tax=Gymnodinialimonas phycosphaerae TaxID=2841589 RepID=A0A975TTU4_9RHOB|nr:DNA polymerase Y family protein [Gymnodinialimonas phycosphaerae]MBY4894417.1 DNA polymerase Y family protein [Gymnodinialimonas phycosphaerae]
MPHNPPRQTARHTAESSHRRILSLWFPRLGAERVLRGEPALAEMPLVTVAEIGNLRQVAATTQVAEGLGLSRGQSLSEAMVLCPDLITRPEDRGREATLLAALRRWAGKFSPWVAEEGAESLIIDLTGCAHLFGGEEALFAQVHEDCADLGLSVCAGLADTAGAAWALARYAGGHGIAPGRSGDAIDQEARATRSRARKRHWVKGGPAPAPQVAGTAPRIAQPGGTRQALAPLPIAALRVEADIATGLARLGLRQIGDVLTLPRASLARRFGQGLMRRIDQALGTLPEPISPAGAPLHFAVRLSLPEPIGLEADIMVGLERLLPVLCEKLRARGRGARRVRLELSRVEGDTQAIEIGLALPADQPDKLYPLFEMKLGEVDAGFGIDRLRVIADVTEPLHATEHKGGWAVAQEAAGPRSSGQDMADLIARLGARVGLEAIRRARPADSHIPEKTSVPLAAAWSEAEAPGTWPAPTRPRPLTLFSPEPVTAPHSPHVPSDFRWRGRRFQVQSAQGPERIAPEWWLDERQWRTGVRDYWRVTTADGARLWLYYAHGGAQSGGWFAQGDFG